MESMTCSKSDRRSFSRSFGGFSTEEIGRQADWQDIANTTLHDAMINERSKRWNKVASNYQSLLKLLYDAIPSDDKDRPAWLTLLRRYHNVQSINRWSLQAKIAVTNQKPLMKLGRIPIGKRLRWVSKLEQLYECHYHLGVALQQLNQQKKSINEFTRAIESVYISRNGCMVDRCRIASCLTTPIYARRAFAHANSGDLKNATLDAEKAVVLDSTNPDVYCVRALVLNTSNKKSQAAEDIKKALKLNPNHVCALILKGQIKERDRKEWDDYYSATQTRTLPEEHVKAAKLNPDSYHYLTVSNFHHEKIVAFYDKFLYSLNVPHTISSVMLGSSDSSSQDAGQAKDGRILSRSSSLPALSSSSSSNRRMSIYSRMSSTVVGVAMTTDGLSCTTRSQIKTASSSSAGDRGRRRIGTTNANTKRKPHYSDQLTPRTSLDRRRAYGQAVTSGNAKTTRLPMFISVDRPTSRIGCKTQFQSKSFDESYAEPQHIIRTPEGLQIFQDVNLYDAPRLYYRPWMGDRFPVREVERKQSVFPPFKV